MKHWRVFTRQKALEDTQDIYSYIAHDNPTSAEAFLNALEEAATLLSQTPEIGSPRYFEHPELQGLRYCVLTKFPNYLLFYRLLRAEQSVEIVRIVHGARDLPTLFGKEEPSDPKKD
jgi:toxin ParE1/3/4